MAESPVLYVYYRPANDDAYPGVPGRHITEADWARFSPSQRRTVEEATTQEGYTRRKVWVHRDLVDETEQERAEREAAEQAARDAYERGRSLVRYREFEKVLPGPGEVIVGTADGPVNVKLSDLGIDWTPGYTDRDRTLSVVGDLHFGYGSTQELKDAAQDRYDQTAADLSSLNGQYNRRVYVGDLVETPGTSGTTPGANDTAALAWMNALDDDWDAVAGNHDLSANRTAQHWAQVYGYSSPNWTKDYGPFRVIAIASDGPSPTSLLSEATLDYLDTQLSASSKDTVILCHFPLWGTVAPHPVDKGYTSFGDKATGGDHVLPDDDVRTVLDKHDHARVWLCGHSHSPVTAPGLFMPVWTGSRHIISINAGSPVYTDGNAGALGTDAPRSLFVTMHDNRVAIKVRNHRDGAWENTVEMPFGGPQDNPASMVMTFDGEIAAQDRNGAATFTWSGTQSYETMGSVQGLIIDGSDSLKVTPSTWILPETGAIAVRARFTVAEDTASRYPVYHNPSGDPNRLNLIRQSDGTFRAQLGTATINATSPLSMNNTDVHTFGMSWSAGQFVRLYVDGVLQDIGHSTVAMSVIDEMTIGQGRNIVMYGVLMADRSLTEGEHARLHEAAQTGLWAMDTLA